MGKKKAGTDSGVDLDDTIEREYTNLATPTPSDQGSPAAEFVKMSPPADINTSGEGDDSNAEPQSNTKASPTPSPNLKPAGSPTLTAAGKKGKKGKAEPPSTPGSKNTDEDGLVSVAEAMRSKITKDIDEGRLVSVAEAMRSKNKTKMNFVCHLIKRFTGLQISIEAKEETYKEMRKQEGKRRVWPFVLFTTLVMMILLMYDACNIHPPKRKDCGYPGISVTECYIWGKYQSHKDGMKEMIRCLSGWCLLGSSCWWLSGYDVQSLLIYFLLSALATYHQATACYDGHVPPGVPHCYCS